MSVFYAKKGEQKDCVVIQQVLLVYWTRTRARPGEKVKAGAIVKDVKDGKKVKLDVIAGDTLEVLKTLEGTLSGGKVEVEWTIQVPERPWREDGILLALDAVVDEKITSTPGQRPVLHLDVALPEFSV